MYGLTSEMVYRLCDVALTKRKTPYQKKKENKKKKKNKTPYHSPIHL